MPNACLPYNLIHRGVVYLTARSVLQYAKEGLEMYPRGSEEHERLRELIQKITDAAPEKKPNRIPGRKIRPAPHRHDTRPNTIEGKVEKLAKDYAAQIEKAREDNEPLHKVSIVQKPTFKDQPKLHDLNMHLNPIDATIRAACQPQSNINIIHVQLIGNSY